MKADGEHGEEGCIETCRQHSTESRNVSAFPGAALAPIEDDDDAREPCEGDRDLTKRQEEVRTLHFRSAAQQIGVQRPATALTGSDPASQVCRQTAPKVN